MKVLILDSGILINLSMNGLLYIFEELKKITGVRFIISKDVKYEVVDRPIGIPRFELGALRVNEMINQKILETPQDFGVSEEEIKPLTDKYMQIANNSIYASNNPIRIVSEAEISCLALSKILTDKGIDNIIGIDERTTRLLAEKPENLEQLMQKRLHKRVTLKKDSFSAFKGFKFLRSTELVYVAYKKGVLKVKGPKVLEATLYATKFKGASVSYEELDVMKRL